MGRGGRVSLRRGPRAPVTCRTQTAAPRTARSRSSCEHSSGTLLTMVSAMGDHPGSAIALTLIATAVNPVAVVAPCHIRHDRDRHCRYRDCRRAHSLRGWSLWHDRTRYSPEIRERAVRLVREHGAGASVAVGGHRRHCPRKLGCTSETLRRWVRQAERDTGHRAGLTTDERQRLKELERENRRAEAGQWVSCLQGVGVFRAGGARPPEFVMVAFIDQHRPAPMGSSRSATVLPIAPSTYFRCKGPAARSLE